jgi:hypothetical protein|tara:strand:+ start:587 stop:946 length:360 start_codon:yes stop_codon:yes gene_type:complete
MGRYYNGDVEGKFMFAVQNSNAHERFGAVEENSGYVDYVVYRDSYNDIVEELDKIDKGSIKRVENMFNNERGYNDEIQKKYEVTPEDLSEYADYEIGMQLKKFFDKNKDCYECRFEAEL